jgi:hypothetical protein
MDVKAVKERYKKQLFSLPNVISLGVGPKILKGQATGETAIKVFVSKKVDSSELEEQDCVPSQLDGVPTDVEVLGPSKKF